MSATSTQFSVPVWELVRQFGATGGRKRGHKILRDCRQHGDGLHHAVQAVAHMHNLALAS
ncbi:hypothetical protein GCM10022295_91750 [Streptomyces osmaniensis]|uniref:Transposase n=1 Tax=Streptomyces osmaniensis TaxID=593134 RepID=A0ABP6Z1M1_9ACTN